MSEDPATVAVVVTRARSAQLRFGATPDIDGDKGVYRIGVPAEGVAEDRTAAPTLDDFKKQLRA